MSKFTASAAENPLGRTTRHRQSVAYALLLAGVALAACNRPAASSNFLRGTWALQSAYEIQPNGKFAYPYGRKPQGILMVDKQGRYVVEIYGDTRPGFSSSTPTADQYKAAFLSMSVHTGTVEINDKNHVLTFRVKQNANPDRSGTVQERPYQLTGDVLTYRVPAAAEGKVNTPVSIWKRMTS